MIAELKSIFKSYGNREVLKDVSLQIRKGDSIAVTGPSGSGKTTLLNILGTLDSPDKGEFLFCGQKLNDVKQTEMARIRNEQIGFVFQMHYLLPQCTLLENILIPAIPLHDKLKKAEAKKRAITLIERTGLSAQMNQLPGELSGGECQRAAFVRALVNRPSLLLADEPTGSLDAENANILGQLLLELNDESGTALLVVTHSEMLAAKMKKRYLLQNGCLIQS
jgi:lipoprotein-releasing system ATP-binding protein